MRQSQYMRALACLSLLTPCLAPAATYYVSPNGNDLAIGTAANAPWRTLARVNLAHPAQGDQVLLERGGTWRETLQVTASGLYFGAYGTGARPVVTGADVVTGTWTSIGNNVWRSTAGDYDMTQVWFAGARGTPVSSVSAVIAPGHWYWDGSNLYIYSTSDPRTAYTSPGVEFTKRANAFQASGVGSLTVEHIAFTKGMYVSVYLSSGLTGTQTFQDVVWQDAQYEGFKAESGAPHVSNSEGLYNEVGLAVAGGDGLTLSNSILSGNRGRAIEIYGVSGASLVDSSTISGNATDSLSVQTVANWSNLPLVVSNSILLANPIDPKEYSFVGVTDAGSNAYTSPRFTTRGAPLIVVPYVDDYINLPQAEAIASTAASYGCHLSYAINTKLVTPADWVRITNLKNAGHEIVAHTRSHPDLANNRVFTIVYSGPASSATMSINGTPGRLQTFLNASSTPDLNIDISDSYDSILNVCTKVNSHSGYTCTPQDRQNFFTPLLLASVNKVSIKTSYVAQAASNYLTWEIEGSKADIQANIPGYTATSFATPFSSSSLLVENHIRDAGFADNRNGTLTESGQPNGTWLFSQLDLYDLAAEWFPDNFDSNKPAGSVASLVEGLGAKGGVAAVYSHGYDEFSLSQWQQFFQTLQQIGGTCMTASQAVAYVKANGKLVPDGTNRTWTRLLKPTPNFTTTAASPAQGAHGLQ